MFHRGDEGVGKGGACSLLKNEKGLMCHTCLFYDHGGKVQKPPVGQSSVPP